ncbi:MAG: hypothetical protein GJV46_05880 [Geobacter sp.]|nr:hypothetical protein [Geobacter sp.]
MSNILLITDVARLRKVFGVLTDDSSVNLRVANNLEKGGEEIAADTPDLIFLQTHLSGLSPEILIMHLKKQLGSKNSRFILLAAPNQVSESILALFQGWLDTSLDDDQLIRDLQAQIPSLASKVKEKEASSGHLNPPDDALDSTFTAQSEGVVAVVPAVVNVSEEKVSTIADSPAIVAELPSEDNALAEQNITYSPRPRMSVYSEFNSSFDDAVNSAPEPESFEQSSSTADDIWGTKPTKNIKTTPERSKRLTFLYWLVPVIIAVIVTTLFQQRMSRQVSPAKVNSAESQTKSDKHASVLNHMSTVGSAKSTLKPVSSAVNTQSKSLADPGAQANDKAMIVAITESREKKNTIVTARSAALLTRLPDFIPRGNVDKTYSDVNPGWEKYISPDVEYRVYRDKNHIKAIQIIALGGVSISNALHNGILKQLLKNAHFEIETTETKEGYKVERGHIAENLKVVYYRDEKGNRLRAFVLTWK